MTATTATTATTAYVLVKRIGSTDRETMCAQ